MYSNIHTDVLRDFPARLSPTILSVPAYSSHCGPRWIWSASSRKDE